MQEKHARTIWNFEIRTHAKPCAADIFSGRNDRSFQKFRVRAVITTSIPLRIYLKAIFSLFPVEWLWTEPEKNPEKGEKTRRERQKILSCECLKSPYKSRVPRRWGTEWRFRFRVSHLRPLGQLSVYLKCNPCSGRMQEKHARTIWNCEIRTRAKPCAADIFSGRNGRSFQKFRVSPIITTSISLCDLLWWHLFYTTLRQNARAGRASVW